jgi:hypothetical protein
MMEQRTMIDLVIVGGVALASTVLLLALRRIGLRAFGRLTRRTEGRLDGLG